MEKQGVLEIKINFARVQYSENRDIMTGGSQSCEFLLELVHRGALGDDLRVPEDAVRLGGVELGRDGKPIEHHRIWDVAAIVDKRQIERGGSVTDDYTIELPEGTTGPLTVRVWWNFRRSNQDFTDWVFDGDGTTFPVHEMGAAEIVVP